ANTPPVGAVLGQYVDQLFNNTQVALNTGGTFDLGGKSECVAAVVGGGTVTNSVAATSSRLYIGSVSGVNVDSTFAGVIQNGAGAVELEKLGAVTLTLSGVNTYTGSTIITTGTLIIAPTGSLGN